MPGFAAQYRNKLRPHWYSRVVRKQGHVITVDIATLTDITQPRIDFLTGSSTDRATYEQVVARIVELRPKNVITHSPSGWLRRVS